MDLLKKYSGSKYQLKNFLRSINFCPVNDILDGRLGDDMTIFKYVRERGIFVCDKYMEELEKWEPSKGVMPPTFNYYDVGKDGSIMIQIDYGDNIIKKVFLDASDENAAMWEKFEENPYDTPPSYGKIDKDLAKYNEVARIDDLCKLVMKYVLRAINSSYLGLRKDKDFCIASAQCMIEFWEDLPPGSCGEDYDNPSGEIYECDGQITFEFKFYGRDMSLKLQRNKNTGLCKWIR